MNKLLLLTFNDGLDATIEELKIELALTTDRQKRLELMQDLYRFEELKNKRDLNRIKPVDILKALGGFAGLLIVLRYEQTNIITSKLWGKVSKWF